MAELKHSGGIVQSVLELGFDRVKYFELTASGTAAGFSITPPARRILVRNIDTNNSTWINLTGSTAEPTSGNVPGDNIRIRPTCTFNMDLDTLTSVSFVTTSGSPALVEGVLGWKASGNC